jgi:hypothetical protein
MDVQKTGALVGIFLQGQNWDSDIYGGVIQCCQMLLAE